MKQLSFLFGKIFIFTTILFWIAVSICLLIFAVIRQGAFILLDWQDYLPNVFREAVVFGGFAALITSLIHYFQVRKIAQGKPFDLSTTQRRSLELSSPPQVIFKHCIAALDKIQARIIEKNKTKCYINAQTFMPNLTNVIRIDITSVDDSCSKVNIICHPIHRITITDYGSNYENAEKLLSYLGELK